MTSLEFNIHLINTANNNANNVLPSIIQQLEPFIGKKIVTKNLQFISKLSDKMRLPYHETGEGFKRTVTWYINDKYITAEVRYYIKNQFGTYQENVKTKTVAKIKDGILENIMEIKPYKTDLDINKAIEIQEKVDRLTAELREVEKEYRDYINL